MGADTLHRIDKNDVPKAAFTLTRAFLNDLIIKKLNLDQKTAGKLYTTPIKIGLRLGEVYSTSDAYEGVMVFCSGEKANPNLWDMLKSGILTSSLGMIKLFANRDMRQFFVTMEKDKKNLTIGPFFYLMAIGVLPEYQGKGYGGQLLKYLCERADGESKAIYLETQNEKNAQWYETFGFKVVKNVTFSKWLPLWEMVRKPS